MRNFILTILSLLLFAVSALFFAQNDAVVTIRYFSGEMQWQLNWVMVLCLIVGFALGVASLAGGLMRARFQLRRTRNQLHELKKELNNLRALPIKSDY